MQQNVSFTQPVRTAPVNAQPLTGVGSKVSKHGASPPHSETMRLIRNRGMEVCVEIAYLSLHCHHQNDICINLVGDESHFNVS